MEALAAPDFCVLCQNMKKMHLLTFEKDKEDDQLFIHADSEGIRILLKSLNHLLDKIENGMIDHDHLMTDDWGGWELSNEIQDKEGKTKLIHHVKIIGWPSKENNE